MVISLAAEFAPSIRVNAIAPSLTRTPLAGQLTAKDEKLSRLANAHPLGRLGEPEDIANMAAFLLNSQESSWITGQIIRVDGGRSVLRHKNQ